LPVVVCKWVMAIDVRQSVVAEVAAELRLKMGAVSVARSCLCPVPCHLISHDTVLLSIIMDLMIYIYVLSVW
jgi:hypothetical protein